MQNAMRRTFPITIGVLLLAAVIMITTSAVNATHVASVSISPSEVQAGAEIEFKVLVQNAGGDNINYFEVSLPMNGDVPYYIVKEAAEPAGWDLNTIYKVGSSYPYKITWSTSGVGIEEGKSLEFMFKAIAPSDSNQFSWDWKSVDVNGGVRTGTYTTKTITSPFSTLKLVVPKNIKAGDYFQVTVSAINQDGSIKTDYTGTVSFECTDKMAIIPKTYTFQSLDQGVKQFTFKLKTAGDQSISLKTGNTIISSGTFYLKPGSTASVKVSLDRVSTTPGSSVGIKVTSIDLFLATSLM